MSVLSDREIIEAHEAGNIIIEPFNLDHLGNCSYDITLGEYYCRLQPAIDTISPTGVTVSAMNPFNAKDVHGLWSQPIQAVDNVIILKPHATILCHSQEFIGGRHRITTMLKARSSLGRAGINLSMGGWGDVGFNSRWTFALTNLTDHPMQLPVKQKIAQIVFLRTGETRKDYTGQYQTTADLNRLKSSWTPQQMLPPLPTPCHAVQEVMKS
jgi:deoxycytidine triphosphate deaminase